MNLNLMRLRVKQLYTILTCLNRNSIIIFSDYNKQISKVIKKAAYKNKILFLPEKCGIVDKKNRIMFCSLVSFYKSWFSKVNCDYFVINTLPRGDLGRHAALVAANEVNNVKVVYLDHGDTGFNDPSGVWHWLYYADYFYASNTESKKYLERLQIWGYYHGNSIMDIGKVAVKEWKRPLPKRKKADRYVLFAPGFYNGELFIGQLTDTAKYKHTEIIMKHLNQLGLDYGYRIIYKTIKGSDSAFNPRSMDKFNDYEAFEYVDSANFNKLLSKASAFVTDCVSTPFYDAVDMGVPRLCLYNSIGTPLRNNVSEMFGDSIKVCKEDNTIGYAINNFFASNFSLGSNAKVVHNIESMPWGE